MDKSFSDKLSNMFGLRKPVRRTQSLKPITKTLVKRTQSLRSTLNYTSDYYSESDYNEFDDYFESSWTCPTAPASVWKPIVVSIYSQKHQYFIFLHVFIIEMYYSNSSHHN